MIDFFKQKEEKPFAYLSIEMRKSSKGYYKWVAVIILVVALIIVLFIK
jgi:putative lipoic acid-binding regulatory protein